MIPVNPAEAVQPLRHETRNMVLWTSEQTARFLDVARTHRLYAAFYLLMSSGLRRGEFLALQWDDLQGSVLRVSRSLVDNDGQLHISTPKTAKGIRLVPLSADVLDVLEDHRKRQEAEKATLGDSYEDTGIMFASNRGTYIEPRNLRRVFYALQERTRAEWVAETTARGDDAAAKLDAQKKLLPRIRLHDLRHLHASIAIQSGMNPKVLADRLGHKNASLTLDVYTHLFEAQRAQSAVSVASLLAPRDPLN